MAIEADGIRRRIGRLKELAGKFEEEWAQVSSDGGLLRWAEQQQYTRGSGRRPTGYKRGGLVLADALVRVESGAG